MGSWWAYYTLGWGGWWFWDPVENASFMPWLVGTALLHSAIVVEKRDALKSWTILLAIIAFSLSLVGTFLVRSGVLTSVHAFAVDPARGIFILLLLLVAIGGSLALYACARRRSRAAASSRRSRARARWCSTICCSATGCATVFLGTLYPLFLDAMGGPKLSVGLPFFNRTFVPLMVPVLIAVAVGPAARLETRRSRRRAAAAVAGAWRSTVLVGAGRPLCHAAAGRCWRCSGSGSPPGCSWRRRPNGPSASGCCRAPLGESWRRARHLPRAATA